MATEAAVLLLRPRGVSSSTAPVDARDYFSEEELARARAFRRGQRALALASTALDAALLTALVAKPPKVHPAIAAAGMTVGMTVAGLPLSAWSRQRSVKAGLITQSWGGWAADIAKAQAISAPLTAGGGVLLVGAMRRFGDRWWLPGAGGMVAGGVLAMIAGPLLIDPLFNRFDPADPDLRARVTRLADAAGIKVDRVLVMDASKRTTASNAYVSGFGAAKRVVFFDTLLEDFTEDEVDFVVAHELAHVRHRDLLRGLAIITVASPAMVFAIAEVADALGAEPDASALAAVSLAAGLVSPALGVVTNGFSRTIERRADRFAMQLVGNPQTQIGFQKQITLKNLGEPDPPKWVQWLYGSHPTTLERIAMAEEARASAS